MFPLNSIINTAPKTYNLLHMNSKKDCSTLKQLAKISYNATLPPLAATVVAVISIVGLILAAIWNVFALPPAALHYKIQHHGIDQAKTTTPEAKTMDAASTPSIPWRILKTLYTGDMQNLFLPAHPQSSESNKKAPALFTLPPLPHTQPKTLEAPPGDTFLTEFFEGKQTVPGTNISWQNLASAAGTTQGTLYLKTTPLLVELLLPKKHPNSKNIPPLSPQVIYQIQTDPKIASQYLLGVLIVLQLLGVELNAEGEFCASEKFEKCAKFIKQQPERQKWLLELTESLVNSGFGSLGQRAADFFFTHRSAYGLSPGQKTGPTSLPHTVRYISKLQKVFPYPSSGVTSWITAKGTSYLEDGFTTEDISTLKPPQWFTAPMTKRGKHSSDPVFSSPSPLLQWDVAKQKWRMPHLITPPPAPEPPQEPTLE